MPVFDYIIRIKTAFLTYVSDKFLLTDIQKRPQIWYAVGVAFQDLPMSFASEHTQTLPVLIFDKEGYVGHPLATRLSEQCVTVLVSKSEPQGRDQLLYIPYRKQIPTIPAARFSHFYFVYSGDKRQLELLPAFMKKARVDNTQVFFVTSLRFVNEDQLLKLLDEYSRITLLLIGDACGDPHLWPNPAQQMLHEAASGRITISGTGLDTLYPVSAEDIIAMLFAAYVRQHTGRVLYLLPPHPSTALSFARTIIKKEPLIHMVFADASRRTEDAMFHPSRYVSVFGQEYIYEPVIPSADTQSLPHPLSVAPKHRQLPVRFIPRNVVFLVLLLALLIVSLPLLAVAGGSAFLLRSVDQMKQGELGKARSSAAAANNMFLFADKGKGMISTPLATVGLRSFGDQFTTTVQSGIDGSIVITASVDAMIKMQHVTSGRSLDPENEFAAGLQDMKYALSKMAVMRAEGRIPKSYESYGARFDGFSNVLTEMMDVLPVLAGMERKQTYLVLLQNNMELRPSGGFIGSYGLLTLDKGKIADFVIQDVYDADGQLKEHVEPPFALKRYLGASHWFLRDSNYDVDFPKSAAMAAYFYNLEMGKKVDGVIAVDISFIRELLKAFGPVKVSDYNETVTAENFFLLTETYAQSDFFPGSTQKKDFLTAVYNALFFKLTEQKDIPYGNLAEAVGQSVRQKHLLFAFPDLTVQRVFSLNGFSSSLPTLHQEDTVADFFALNESNIGANKSNYYIDRSITHAVVLHADGSASESATIKFHNRSKDASPFGGEYKTYLRLILPRGAVLDGVQIDGKQIAIVPAITDPEIFTSRSFIPPAGLEIETYEQGNYTVHGLLTIVPPGARKTLTFTYSLPAAGRTLTKYSLRLFKQPGTEADPYLLTLRIPDGLRILTKPEGMRVAGDTATMITDISEDRNIPVSFGQK